MASWLSRPAQIARLAGALAVAVGVVVLVGWITGTDVLKSLVPGTLTMKANTALAFALMGGGFLVLSTRREDPRWQAAGYGLCGVAGMLSAVVGSQYLTGRDLGVDLMLFQEAPEQAGTVHPGRMSPQAALSFVALAVAVLIARRPWAGWLVTGLGAVPLLLGLLNILDWLFGAQTPTLLAAYTQMAIPTAVTLAMLGAGVVSLTPHGGWLSVFTGSHPSNRLARRLLLAAVIIPVLISGLQLEGERRGLYDTAYGLSLDALATLVLFAVVIRHTATAGIRSDRRRTEAELAMAQAREHAERANRAKSEFLSRMSHELRTPLNSILGFGQLLELDDLTPEQRESVGYIVKGGRHLLNLIDDVLDIARIETGRVGMSLEPVAIREVVEEAVALATSTGTAMGIVPVVEDAMDGDVHAWADRHRLRQVLLNLLSNAIKYNRRGGSVKVTYREVSPARVRIAVTDEGRGVASEYLDRLFVPFDRLGAESSSVEGTGIGLALSKALVDAMGGTIGVESEVGRGSMFWLELARSESPLERYERLQRTRPEARMATDIGPRTVLYIEDNPPNVKLVERVLAMRPGIRLTTAGTGQQGIDMAGAEAPDLVLLDLDLPDLDGEEVLARLRAQPATSRIPVVVLSADATQASTRRLLTEGATAYLTKPLDVERLLTVINEVLAPAEVAA